ncbi:hypothetical protein BCD_1416 (plasmid) [Borrelia crocidurae DOU]|uniref:Uncharacterized protein n=1 Tax=Borrelia crocidurae DOU TaxID=1293575 RepID=W5SKP3_9SPIR|nr:hypothetical protein BCD_1416 [Borrelia crocidurae DOU]
MWCNINLFGCTYIEEGMIISNNAFSIGAVHFKLNGLFGKINFLEKCQP